MSVRIDESTNRVSMYAFIIVILLIVIIGGLVIFDKPIPEIFEYGFLGIMGFLIGVRLPYNGAKDK